MVRNNIILKIGGLSIQVLPNINTEFRNSGGAQKVGLQHAVFGSQKSSARPSPAPLPRPPLYLPHADTRLCLSRGAVHHPPRRAPPRRCELF